MLKRSFLDPSLKLVDATVNELMKKVRRDADSGASSLAHVLVVVPTAQAGRQLRLALARKCQADFCGRCGLLPPVIAEPAALIKVSKQLDERRTATLVELRAAFLAFTDDPGTDLSKWSSLFNPDTKSNTKLKLGFFDQLSDIWRALAGDGLLMQDVLENSSARKLLERAEGNELVHWEELASLEKDFFAFLKGKGLRHDAEVMRIAKERVEMLPEGIDTVALPSLVDPVRVFYHALAQWMQTRNDLTVEVMIHADEADSMKFDVYGRPLPDEWTGDKKPVYDFLRDEDIIRAASNRELAAKIAECFGEPYARTELPALGLADSELYADLQASFLNRGYMLHNPERHPLGRSSLGVLLDVLVRLWESEDNNIEWSLIVSLVRINDAMAALVKSGISRDALLSGVDKYSGMCFPRIAPSPTTLAQMAEDSEPRDRVDLIEVSKALAVFGEWIRNARKAVGVAGFVRSVLNAVYSVIELPEEPHNKEFAAACDAANKALDSLRQLEEGGFALKSRDLAVLARDTFKNAVYQLEPEGENIIKSEGWLELAWSASRLVAIAGFREGAVPDSLIGHAFLPDSLREALGLTSNRQRFARDIFLLGELLSCRQPGEVLSFVALANAAGDIQRPSRLLFLCDDKLLAKRVERLFTALAPHEAPPPRRPSKEMTYKWESAFDHAKNGDSLLKISPSAVDAWLSCPFTYMLTRVCKLERVEEKKELDARDMGLLIHRVLEGYSRLFFDAARAADRKSIDEALVGFVSCHETEKAAAFEGLRSAVSRTLDNIFNATTACFYPVTAGIKLQLDAARGRILESARIQAQWLAEGWKPVAAEYKVGYEADHPVKLFDRLNVSIRGSVDRIDYNPQYGYRIIDYKSWDDPDNAKDHIFSKGADELAFAAENKLPTIKPTAKSRTERRMTSVQLALYAAALETADPEKFKGKICDLCYLVLGNSPSKIQTVGSAFNAGASGVNLIALKDFALDTAKIAATGIVNGVYWPPAPSDKWRYNYRDLFMIDPVRETDGKWIEEQTARRRLFLAEIDGVPEKEEVADGR